MIATEVATEKSSRVMEILISSVPPVQQMFAKLFGVALLGLTQLAALLLAGYLSLQSSQESGGDAAELVKGFLMFPAYLLQRLCTRSFLDARLLLIRNSCGISRKRRQPD
ncbi:ABC transporter permease [Bacillus licheniformis]|nr:ABC transporter permease [Bacillus licheniformis]